MRTAVINVVGLNQALLEHAPNIARFVRERSLCRLKPVLPAVTCSVQSSMLTGTLPREHGIVGNGWYDRDLCEIQFWKQSNKLVRGKKIWDIAREKDPSFSCANLFWWYNMYSSVDVSVTPRPIYKADGRKIPDISTNPPELRKSLQAKFGRFPLFNFWGPASSIRSSEWIARAAMEVVSRFDPMLSLIYLPHLDYGLQKYGPDDPRIPAVVAQIDELARELIDFFISRGTRIIILSEYGIEAVNDSVHINRILREASFLRVREEDGLELLDPGGSDAFAVADHQIAHVYFNHADRQGACRELLESTPGVDLVLDREGKRAHGIDHPRAGDLVLVAERGRWFSYDYWLDDARAPDFARTVDIHRKPGYDPCELFFDPALSLPKARIAWKLLKKKFGFRTLMDVIPLDTRLVKGSHGRTQQPQNEMPILIAEGLDRSDQELPCTAVRDIVLAHLFSRGA